MENLLLHRPGRLKAALGLLLLTACGSEWQSAEEPGGIREIAIYQGVKVPIMEDGEPVAKRNAPIVQGRSALLRVFIENDPDLPAREAVLELATGAGAVETRRAELAAPSDSKEADLATTFNFDLPGDRVVPGLRYAVSIFASGEAEPLYRWPPGEATALLGAESTGGALEVVLVPIRYDADGSGRMPALGPAEIALYRERLYALFPVPRVEIAEGEPLVWPEPVERDGGGWSLLLAAVQQARDKAGAPPGQFYVGLVNPADTLERYCESGCVTGFSSLAEAAEDDWARAVVALGFGCETTAQITVHELGHAHGLEHAPCGFAEDLTDPDYPYDGGSIGSWGYDLRTGALKSPDRHADFMGNCPDPWISDYHFRALAARRAEIAAGQASPPGRAEAVPGPCALPGAGR